MREIRRMAAYGRYRDGLGRTLVTRAVTGADISGLWHLPGDVIAHGEHPAATVERAYAAQAGLAVRVTGLCDVLADVVPLPDQGVALHTDRIIYDVAARVGGVGSIAGVGGPAGPPEDADGDDLAWLAGDEATRPVMPYTAELLGLPADPAPPGGTVIIELEPAAVPIAAVLMTAEPIAAEPMAAVLMSADPMSAEPTAAEPLPKGRRFAAYGLVTDAAGRILLTRIAEGFPGAGLWHLPGGGTDHGEHPLTGFLRELAEETGQVARHTGVLGVSHRRGRAQGPEGYPMDWHAVRVVYRALVEVPTPARVTEGAGGSTERAGWFSPERARTLALTEIAALALGELAGGGAPPPGGVPAAGGSTG